MSEQNTSTNIQLYDPTVPKSPNVSFNSPTLPETDSETIGHIALTDSTQDQILGVTSHYNSVDIYLGTIIEAREDKAPADNKEEFFGGCHTSAPTLTIKRDRTDSNK